MEWIGCVCSACWKLEGDGLEGGKRAAHHGEQGSAVGGVVANISSKLSSS